MNLLTCCLFLEFLLIWRMQIFDKLWQQNSLRIYIYTSASADGKQQIIDGTWYCRSYRLFLIHFFFLALLHTKSLGP